MLQPEIAWSSDTLVLKCSVPPRPSRNNAAFASGIIRRNRAARVPSPTLFLETFFCLKEENGSLRQLALFPAPQWYVLCKLTLCSLYSSFQSFDSVTQNQAKCPRNSQIIFLLHYKLFPEMNIVWFLNANWAVFDVDLVNAARSCLFTRRLVYFCLEENTFSLRV